MDAKPLGNFDFVRRKLKKKKEEEFSQRRTVETRFENNELKPGETFQIV